MNKTYFSFTILLLLLGQTCLATRLEFAANYRVPVKSAELEPFSRFSINNYVVFDQGVASRIEYSLPLILTGGDEVQITLHQINQVGAVREFSGPLGTAVCQGVWGKMSCETKFDLNISKQKIEAFVASNIEPSKQKSVLQVALGFSTEPIGFTQTNGLTNGLAFSAAEPQ